MSVPVFIGDELTGAGFRLAGLTFIEARPEDLGAAFRDALRDAPLIVLTARAAAALPQGLVRDAVRRANPPVAIVPEAVAGPPLPDVTREVRAALGVES